MKKIYKSPSIILLNEDIESAFIACSPEVQSKNYDGTSTTMFKTDKIQEDDNTIITCTKSQGFESDMSGGDIW